ncbi:hypothetical protein ACHAWF_003754, partial [Thalassiosira exigua]
ALKEERSQFLWKTLEKIIPDVRQRAVHVQVGTPLTHARFLNRRKGTYGPAIRADEGSFPFPNTPVKGLLQCGDSCFPGIGVPAACASGTIAANLVNLGSVGRQVEALREVSAAAVYGRLRWEKKRSARARHGAARGNVAGWRALSTMPCR